MRKHKTTRPIKILHTIRQGQIGGGETHVLDLIRCLDPETFHSEVLSFTDGEMIERLSEMDIKAHVIPTIRPFDLTVWSQVKKRIKEGGFDLVHAHGTRACSNSYWAANRLKLPLIYTIHGWSFHQNQSGLVNKVRTYVEKVLTHKTQVNIAVSESNQAEGIKRFDMPNSVVIKNGINIEKFNPDKGYSLTHKELGLPDDAFVIGMIARLTVQKDPLSFVKAGALALRKKPELHFALVGGGDLEAEAKSLVQSLGLKEKFSFPGFNSNVPAVLKLLDVYCLPSLWEGLPIGLIEAMAMKKPVVATPVDGTLEVVKDGVNGLLTPTENPEALAENFVRLANDAQLCHQLGEAARQSIEEAFTDTAVAQHVGAIYRELTL